ncbi:leucine-rich repeat domain-containing protein [Streptomyces sp. NPDC059909]|uniref:leucine-rich repeat domain-containing protein n=1 Tax=Streptomyces sp. NPDC059909 TaxID=3346998 RepID=UPI0036603E09
MNPEPEPAAPVPPANHADSANQQSEWFGPDGRPVHKEQCTCFSQHRANRQDPVGFHAELQDTSSPGWRRLLDNVDEAVADGREEFSPLHGLSPLERRDVITLPPTIGRLTAVKHLMLYGSNLVRIPPEIGGMTNLEEFTPYTSHRLHWFPYEITRCTKLTRSTVSTRSLFGNFKLRPPFPRLSAEGDPTPNGSLGTLDPTAWGATAIRTCSVCDCPMEGAELHQVWISLVVATDVLPLLVNACSAECVAALPPGADGYAPGPHKGGGDVDQPRAD